MGYVTQSISEYGYIIIYKCEKTMNIFLIFGKVYVNIFSILANKCLLFWKRCVTMSVKAVPLAFVLCVNAISEASKMPLQALKKDKKCEIQK